MSENFCTITELTFRKTTRTTHLKIGGNIFPTLLLNVMKPNLVKNCLLECRKLKTGGRNFLAFFSMHFHEKDCAVGVVLFQS